MLSVADGALAADQYGRHESEYRRNMKNIQMFSNYAVLRQRQVEFQQAFYSSEHSSGPGPSLAGDNVNVHTLQMMGSTGHGSGQGLGANARLGGLQGQRLGKRNVLSAPRVGY